MEAKNRLNPTSIGRPHGYVWLICFEYASKLRQAYPGEKLRNDVMYNSAICEMARRGYIVLVEEKENIPQWMDQYWVRRIKRVKKFPIWSQE
jgi:hypothetical protein